MAKIGNESRLLLKLALERMKAKKLNWARLSDNPNASSNNPDWVAGYDYAWTEWNTALAEIAIELEGR